MEEENPKVLVYTRSLGEQELTVFCNLGDTKAQLAAKPGWENCGVVLGNYEKKALCAGGDTLTLEPYEFLVLDTGRTHNCLFGIQ